MGATMAKTPLHVHASALDALVVLAYLIILATAVRTTAALLSDKPAGQALAYIL